MARILLVDDNLELTRLINLYLASEHHTCLVFNLQQALQMVKKQPFDLVIADRMLPDGDGLAIVECIRAKRLLTPVLVMSYKGDVAERIHGLREGADDYIPKPFAVEELLLKVQHLLHITKRPLQAEVHIRHLTLREDEGKALVDGREILLRPREFAILLFMTRHHNQVITRETLIENLWSEEASPTHATIDVYVRRIRMLLGAKYRKYLKTVRGYGYVFQLSGRLAPVG